jgi:glycosyltransferase involved in cell wall biosynthesis
MGNQCEQLVYMLKQEGLQVELVQSNPPYWPLWVGQIPVLRALARLLPYTLRLWQAAARADVVHVLANSGWAWHLFAAPAVAIARLRGPAVIVNYHGGDADAFFAHAPRYVLKMLAGASLMVIPSTFLQRVAARYGLQVEIIPNGIDLSRFKPAQPSHTHEPQSRCAPHLLVTRNLEPIYDIATAIRAFARIRAVFPLASLTIAGSGPEGARLRALALQLGLGACVHFVGRVKNEDIPRLYASATCLLNPSTVDNMPISILEAFACGVPVVSTRVGGIPDMLEDGVSGLLVPVGDDAAMARSALRILESTCLAAKLRTAGLEQAEKYNWSDVKRQWLNAYLRAIVRAKAPIRCV